MPFRTASSTAYFHSLLFSKNISRKALLKNGLQKLSKIEISKRNEYFQERKVEVSEYPIMLSKPFSLEI